MEPDVQQRAWPSRVAGASARSSALLALLVVDRAGRVDRATSTSRLARVAAGLLDRRRARQPHRPPVPRRRVAARRGHRLHRRQWWPIFNVADIGVDDRRRAVRARSLVAAQSQHAPERRTARDRSRRSPPRWPASGSTGSSPSSPAPAAAMRPRWSPPAAPRSTARSSTSRQGPRCELGQVVESIDPELPAATGCPQPTRRCSSTVVHDGRRT